MTLDEIFTFENLYDAHRLSRRSKQHKRGTILFEIELGKNLAKLQKELCSKKYKLGAYRVFKIHDPKERLIEALPYRDRVVLMCFCKNVLEPRLEPRLIYDNAASRRGRGTSFAINRLHKFMRALFIQNKTNDLYFLKCDIAKYFASINHDILLAKLADAGFSADEMWFMRGVVKSHSDIGLPLGNQTSQWFAILYLDSLDRLIKENLRVKYYIRYMDDFVLLHKDKDRLNLCRARIADFCQNNLNLRLNKKTQVGKLADGVDFLGFNHRLGETGALIRNLRASARVRQGKYLKLLDYCVMNDIVGTDYLAARKSSFLNNLIGTKQKKSVSNRLQVIEKKKLLNGFYREWLALAV
ncbi:MAG: reverse transcriptase/maturase family protein [Rickettsiales bacterium]|jgi:retron-type reverse transcriptase|nr:reverse transcriptase/maturase family protein [Rickettsiales bacterium]